jgi:excisionase family DNA binding protein
MPAPTSAPRYVPIEKAAAYLDTSPRTIRRYIAAGHLTGYRIGKRLLRVDLNELDAILRPLPTANAS